MGSFTVVQSQKGAVPGAMKMFRMAAVVLPFASMEMGSTTFLMTKAVGSFMKVSIAAALR